MQRSERLDSKPNRQVFLFLSFSFSACMYINRRYREWKRLRDDVDWMTHVNTDAFNTVFYDVLFFPAAITKMPFALAHERLHLDRERHKTRGKRERERKKGLFTLHGKSEEWIQQHSHTYTHSIKKCSIEMQHMPKLGTYINFRSCRAKISSSRQTIF